MALTKTQICNMALSKIGDTRAQLTDVDTENTTISRQCLLHYDQTLSELVRLHTWNCCKSRTKICTFDADSVTPASIIVYGSNVADVNGTYNYSYSDGTANIFVKSGMNLIQYDSGLWKVLDSTGATASTNTNDSTLPNPPNCGWSVSNESEGNVPPVLTYKEIFGWSRWGTVPPDCTRPIAVTSTADSSRILKLNTEWLIEEDTILCNNEDIWLLYIKSPTPEYMDSLFANAFYTLLASKLAKPIAGDSQLGMAIYNDFLNVIMPEARRVNSFEGYEAPIVDSAWLEATVTSSSSLGSSYPPFAQSDYGSFSWS